jgi:Phosphodiester glycosidase
MKITAILFLVIYLNLSYSKIPIQIISLEDILGTIPKMYSIPKKFSTMGDIRLYSVEDNSSIRFETKVLFAKIQNPAFRVVEYGKFGKKEEIYKRFKRKEDFLIMNGSFFGYYASTGKPYPIGLVISNNKIIRKPVFNSDWSESGIFFRQNKKNFIRKVSKKINYTYISEAIQSKPLLFELGEISKESYKDSYFDRIMLATTEKNEIIIFGVFDKDNKGASIPELLSISTLLEKKFQFKFQSAVLLDSGPSTYIYIPWIDMKIGYNGDKFIANALHFYSNK